MTAEPKFVPEEAAEHRNAGWAMPFLSVRLIDSVGYHGGLAALG